MAKITKSRLLAYLAMIGNTIAWGLALPIVKRGFDDGLTPNTFLFSRFFIASILAIPIILLIKNSPSAKRSLKPSSLLRIIPLELLGATISLFLLYLGLQKTSAIEATLIATTWPIFITLGALLFLKEKEEGHEWQGLSIAFIGTILLVIRPLFNHNPSGTTTGNLFILAQNFCLAAYFILAKRYYKSFNKWVIACVSFFVSFLSFSLILTLTGHSLVAEFTSLFTNPSPWPLIATVYMAIPGSIIGLTLYLIGQDKIEASEASLFTYLQPLVSLPATYILFGSSIGLVEGFALILIILGIWRAETR